MFSGILLKGHKSNIRLVQNIQGVIFIMGSLPNEKLKGLSRQEVEIRGSQGQTNQYTTKVTKTNTQIIKDNLFTLFNMLNFSIAISLSLVGAFSNLFFILIIIMNVLIGITIEIRARNTVEQLSIVTKAQVTVVRDNVNKLIDSEDIVIDDILILSAGEQIPADAIVIKDKVEANESLLTGESDLVEKEVGDELLSGSFISSGKCYAQVHHVGKDNYGNQLVNEVKIHKPVQSELLGAIRKIAKFTSYIIIPIGIILFVEAYALRGDSMSIAVISSTAALLGMLPKGLALLIVLSLATAVITLGKKKILVQEMHSIEMLAHVDVLCLDKTGTITEGKMKVQQVSALNGMDLTELNHLIGNYISASEDNNNTMQALRKHFNTGQIYDIKKVFPFSSEKKWGAITFENQGTFVIGAPERIITDDEDMPEAVLRAQERGNRVLMFGKTEMESDKYPALKNPSPMAIIELRDPIRKNANQTLDYLKKQGIDLKIISGDNPLTVSTVAKQAGLENYDKYIDLSKLTEEAEVRRAVHQYTVFGRVSPQQKRLLVKELKDNGHTVAMTGDGVNDILALREADCSIAMAEGDSATRQIANLVLLESDFTSLPAVLFEGRRVVNNLTKVASIFFIKTIYSFIMAVICAISLLAFPFIPIQITLIDLVIEGYSSFFLSFEANKERVTHNFLYTVLHNALPNALLIVLNTIVIYFVSQSQGWSQLETTTLMYYVLAGISIFSVIKACMPFNWYRVFIAVTTSVGFYVAAYLFKSILEIGTLTANTFSPFIYLIVISLILRIIYEKMILNHLISPSEKINEVTPFIKS